MPTHSAHAPFDAVAVVPANLVSGALSAELAVLSAEAHTCSTTLPPSLEFYCPETYSNKRTTIECPSLSERYASMLAATGLHSTLAVWRYNRCPMTHSTLWPGRYNRPPMTTWQNTYVSMLTHTGLHLTLWAGRYNRPPMAPSTLWAVT